MGLRRSSRRGLRRVNSKLVLSGGRGMGAGSVCARLLREARQRYLKTTNDLDEDCVLSLWPSHMQQT